MDNTAASVAFVKPMRKGGFDKLGLKLVVDETFTPPLSDATPLMQKVRRRGPTSCFLLPTAISDAKLVLEKMNEFGLGQGRMPTISIGIAIAEPDMLNNVTPELLQGVMAVVGELGRQGPGGHHRRAQEAHNEPWMTQNAISTYGDMWIFKARWRAPEGRPRGGGRGAPHDGWRGPALLPGRAVKFDEKGRRVGAGLVIVQWQDGVPVTVYPPRAGASRSGRSGEPQSPERPPGASPWAGFHRRHEENDDGARRFWSAGSRSARPCSARSSWRSRSRRPTTSTGRCRSWSPSTAGARVWGREELPRKTRSMLNLAMLSALNRPHELKMHMQGALTNGVSREEIREVLLQVAIYCGVPAAVDAFRTAREAFAEIDGKA